MREEIMTVLRMLKDGKITVAEAERLLSVLQKQPETEQREGRRAGAVDAGLWAARRSAKAAAKRARELLSQIDAEKYVSQAMRQLDEAMKQVDRVIRDIEPGKRVQEFVTRVRHHEEEAGQRVRQDVEVGTREETITFPEGEIDSLSVLTPIGDVRARRSDAGSVTVKVILRAEGTDADDAAAKLEEMRVEARRVDGRAEVTVRGREDRWPDGGRADVEVQVPSGVGLELKAVNGDVDAEGMMDDLTAESVNGSVSVRDVKADAKVKSVNGAVSASDVAGDVEISSVNGSATATRVSGDLRINSVNGRVAAEDVTGDVSAGTVNGPVVVERVTGDVKAETVNGGLRAAGISGDLMLKGLNGSIEAVELSSQDVKVQGGGGSVVVGFMEPFHGDLTVETSSGAIRVFLPEGSGCRVTAVSASGGIASEVTLAEEARTEQELVGVLGDGAGEVALKSGNGAIAIVWGKPA